MVASGDAWWRSTIFGEGRKAGVARRYLASGNDNANGEGPSLQVASEKNIN
jgi:hypothetical protein